MSGGKRVGAKPVLDGKRIKWTLEQVKRESQQKVRIDWLRFTLPLAAVVKSDRSLSPDLTWMELLDRGGRDAVRQCRGADADLGYSAAPAVAAGGAKRFCELFPAFEVGVIEDRATREDVAAVNLDRCHSLTGPVFIEGAKRGDAIAVTVIDIAPDEFGTTTIVPGFGFLRDQFPDPYIVHWELNRLEARSKDMPGIVVPNNAFMGTVGVLPGKPELDTWLKREKALADAGGAVLVPQPVDALPSSLCGVDGTAKDECVRTVPPRENGCPIRLARERRQGARAPTPDAPLAEPIAATTCTWARLKT